MFIPNSRNYHYSPNTYLLETIAYCFGCYCGDTWSALFAVLTYTAQLFVGINLVYLKPLTIMVICEHIMRIIMFSFALSVIFAAIFYVQKLQKQLKFTN